MIERARLQRPAEPSLAELEQGLRIDPLDLETSIVQQPELYYRVAKRLAQLQAERDSLKQGLAVAEARAQIQIRDDDNGTRKRTVTEVEALVALDPEVATFKQLILKINQGIGEAAALRESYGQRKSSFSDLVVLRGQVGSPIDLATDRQQVAEMRKQYGVQQARGYRHGQEWQE